jgi:transcriptional regulator GlxA family with amidase domain
VSLLKEDMDMQVEATAGIGARPAGGASVFAPPPMALAHLRSVHNRMGQLAEITPELLTNTDLSRDLEQDLTSAAQDLRNTQRPGSDAIRKRHHHITVTRFRKVLAAQHDLPLRMSEIGALIGVSSRTLRVACQDQLGMSPTEYATLRRLWSVCQALQKASSKAALVTEVATEHGFWQLGRLAVKYRHVFGDSPSATLRSTG